ncbi:MAG: DUF2894 domain-containing protein [Stenotrophomonas sp.]
MALMQELSPEYLQHFIAYVDVLTWMEQLGASSPQSSSSRKPSRASTGKRKKT